MNRFPLARLGALVVEFLDGVSVGDRVGISNGAKVVVFVGTGVAVAMGSDVGDAEGDIEGAVVVIHWY